MNDRNKATFESPFAKSPNAETYAADSLYQHMAVLEAFNRYMQDPFERSMDLRERVFKVTVHPDGLHTTVEEVPQT